MAGEEGRWTKIGVVVAVLTLILTYSGLAAANHWPPFGAARSAHGGAAGEGGSSTSNHLNNQSPPQQHLNASHSGHPHISQALLNQALLPAQSLGPDAVVKYSTTSLPQLTGICGGAPPGGAELTTGRLLQNVPGGTLLAEGITEWQTADEASQAIRNDINALGQEGCSYSNNGNTEQYGGVSSGASPQGCGLYLATTAELNEDSYTGSHVEAACGTFTIAVETLANLTSSFEFGGQQTADGYLNNVNGRLMSALRQTG